MTPLTIFDGRGYRTATPAQIFRQAEVLCGVRFPRTHILHTPEQVAEFTRWCLAPLDAPRILLVVLSSGADEVFQYHTLPFMDAAHAVEQLLSMQVPYRRANHAYLVLAEPQASDDGADPFGEAVRERLAQLKCQRVEYLRVVASQWPAPLPAIDVLEQWRWALDGVQRKSANATDLIGAAQSLCARRLERGQVLTGSAELELPVQLSAGPLYERTVGMVLMDKGRRFLDYRHVCYGGIETALTYATALVAHVVDLEAGPPVLVYTQTGPRVDLTPAECKASAQLTGDLAFLGAAPQSFVVVGTDGVSFYHPYHRSALTPHAGEAKH